MPIDFHPHNDGMPLRRTRERPLKATLAPLALVRSRAGSPEALKAGADLIEEITRDLDETSLNQEDQVAFFAGIAEVVAEELQLKSAPRHRGDVYGLMIANPIDKFLRDHQIDRSERLHLLAQVNLRIAEMLLHECEKILTRKKRR